MRKELFVSTFSLISLLIAIGFIGNAIANPFSFLEGKGIDPIPGTIPPTITISSPVNNSAYNSDSITLNLNVIKPQLTNAWSSIIYIGYTLDNNKEVKLYSVTGDEPGVSELARNVTLSSLPSGNHSITIRTFGPVMPNVKYENGQWYSPSQIGAFTMESNSTIYFTVGSPTMPSLIITIAVVIVIAAVASVSLIYYKRRRGRP